MVALCRGEDRLCFYASGCHAGPGRPIADRADRFSSCLPSGLSSDRNGGRQAEEESTERRYSAGYYLAREELGLPEIPVLYARSIVRTVR